MPWDCNDGCWWWDELAGRCEYSKNKNVTPPCADVGDDEQEPGRMIEASENAD